jgi:hypothetical protein
LPATHRRSRRRRRLPLQQALLAGASWRRSSNCRRPSAPCCSAHAAHRVQCAGSSIRRASVHCIRDAAAHAVLQRAAVPALLGPHESVAPAPPIATGVE